jgi:hypothetical protein
MEIFGVKIGTEDVHALLNFIQEHRNREKAEICLTLEFTLSNIERWYLHYVRVFSPEIARQISGKSFDETRQVSDEITRFIYRNEAIDAAEDCQDYLRKLERDCSSNNLKKSLVEKIDLSMLRNLDEKIMFFKAQAGTKEEWIEKSIYKKRWEVSAYEINETIKKLKMHVEEIRRLVRSLQMNLECDKEETKNFYRQLRNSNYYGLKL